MVFKESIDRLVGVATDIARDKNIVNTAKIKGLIAEKGITQKILADAIGISTASINGKLNGNLDFKANELTQIANYFAIDIKELFF